MKYWTRHTVCFLCAHRLLHIAGHDQSHDWRNCLHCKAAGYGPTWWERFVGWLAKTQM